MKQLKLLSRKEAKAKGLKRYFTGKPCKYGHVDERVAVSGVCMECSRINCRKWKRDNPETHAAINREWAARNPKSIKKTKAKRVNKDLDSFYKLSRKRTRAFSKRHPSRIRANTARQRARRMCRVPAWADHEVIKFFYECCPKGFHVDHIIPLQGELISGLHVETNLQWLPAADNIRKANSFVV